MSGHRRSVRLAAADYGAPGLYFVTIIAARRVPLFGRLAAQGIEFSNTGRAAHDEWLRTCALRPGVVLDAFVIMPDHVHLLFGICDASAPRASPRTGTACRALLPDGHYAIPEGTASRAPTNPNGPRSFGALAPMSVPTIIGGYKSAVSRAVGQPVWQRGYHDRIVRTTCEAANVRRYIDANPRAAAIAAARR